MSHKKRLDAELKSKIISVLLVTALIVFSLFGLFMSKNFVGYLGYMINASAGTITTLTIHHSPPPDYWAGLHGHATYNIENLNNNPRIHVLIPGNISEAVYLEWEFNCMGGTGYDMYASTYDYTQVGEENWTARLANIQGATLADVETWMQYNYTAPKMANEGPNTTFIHAMNISFGGENLTGVSLITKQQSGSGVFEMVALVDTFPGPTLGTLLFGVDAGTYGVGFDGIYRNVQFMLPFREEDENLTYYVFPDPVSDPLGGCRALQRTRMNGYVTHIGTGEFLPNVTIAITSGSETEYTMTNGSGFYVALPYVGDLFLEATKPGFLKYSIVLNISENLLQHNFSMVPDLAATLGNASLDGYITDNSTGLPIPNVTIASGGSAALSNGSGYYYMVVVAGNLTIMAFKDGYNIYYGNNSVEPYQHLKHNITLFPEEQKILHINGTVHGYVTDDFTGLPLNNVSVSVGLATVLTNASGYYTTNTSHGNFTITGIKENYVSHIGNVSVYINNITEYNFSMDYFQEILGRNGTISGTVTDPEFPNNGTITGTVKNSSDNAPLENVTVRLGNWNVITDSSGNYSLNVPAGNYTLIAFDDYFMPFAQNIIINLSQTITYNISLDWFSGNLSANGTITGTVINSSDNTPLENITIMIGGRTTYTNSSGGYSINISENNYTIIAIKDNYENYMANVSINISQTTSHNISLGWFIPFENRGIENATVMIGNEIILTNSSGGYLVNMTPGTHIVVVVKEHYHINYSRVTINELKTTTHNVPLDWFVGEYEKNGTIAGVVTDYFLNTTLENVTIMIGGRTTYTNSSGGYSINI